MWLVVGNSLATGYLVSPESELSYVSQIIRDHVEVSDHVILIVHSAGGVIAYRRRSTAVFELCNNKNMYRLPTEIMLAYQ